MRTNQELAAKIASIHLQYQTDRWFNSYARALNRARKIKATGLTLHCSSAFRLTFAATREDETLWTEQEGYQLFALDEIQEHDASPEVTQFLRARTIACLVELIIRKRSTNLTVHIEFPEMDALCLPRDLASQGGLAQPLACKVIDPLDSSQTPLEAAIESGAVEIIYELLQQGVDVNRKGGDSEGYPLHRLVWGYLDPKLFKDFVSHGADVTLRNAAGQTPAELSKAQVHENPEHSQAISEILRILKPEPPQK